MFTDIYTLISEIPGVGSQNIDFPDLVAHEVAGHWHKHVKRYHVPRE